MSDTHLVIEVRPTCEVPIRRALSKQGLQSKWGLLTNLIAMGWFVKRFTPGRQGLSGGRKQGGKKKEENTLEDNTK